MSNYVPGCTGLFADDFDEYAFFAAAVKLAIEDLFIGKRCHLIP
jgi:hypothetical protein